MGAGHGARIGVVRDYGGSVPVDHALRSRLNSAAATGSRPVSACSDMSSWADVAPEELQEEDDEDEDVFVDAREELSESFLAESWSSPKSSAPNDAPLEAAPCALTVTKKSWTKASQRKRLAVNADHFSKAPLHVALRLRGRKEWHKFDTGADGPPNPDSQNSTSPDSQILHFAVPLMGPCSSPFYLLPPVAMNASPLKVFVIGADNCC